MMRFKKYSLAICAIIIFFIGLLIIRNLTKVMPVDMLYTEAEKNENQIVVHCSAITAFDRYKGYEVNFDNGKAYIKAFYYTVPFLRRGERGDFTVTLDLSKNKVEKVFLADDENRYVEISI